MRHSIHAGQPLHGFCRATLFECVFAKSGAPYYRTEMEVGMDLHRVIYTSRPFGYDQAMLNGILTDARGANGRSGVTGALICRRDLFIQLLEGPQQAVIDTTRRIRRDDRHTDMIMHVERTVDERMFGAWSMLHDPATTWIWSARDVANGAIGRTSPQEVEGFFETLLERHQAA